jgi:hypothetical protein
MSARAPLSPWPALDYPTFAETQHLLHMGLQAVGKLKLHEPFQPQWAGVALWLTARGLTTGPLTSHDRTFEVHVDFVSHEVSCATSDGQKDRFGLAAMSVAHFVKALLGMLRHVGIATRITMLPQEVSDRTPFDRDDQVRAYDASMANTWWRILLRTQHVMRTFEGTFEGKTQPIGLMWGTFDIRMALYNGKPATPAPDSDFIRRNAMNAELIEVGWWSGSEAYPKPAFYAFAYPQPPGIEHASILPSAARWDSAMGEFILDYDRLVASERPDHDLLAFIRTTYEAGARSAGWDASLIGIGRPT